MDYQQIVHNMVEHTSQGRGGDVLDSDQKDFLGRQLTQMLVPGSLEELLHAKNDRAIVEKGDANETYFRGRDLDFLVQDPYPVEYSPLLFRRIVPVIGFAQGAGQYVHRMLDGTGQAAFKSTLSGDHPRAEVNITESQEPIYNATAKYGWNILELQEAALTKMPLDRDRKKQAMDMVERKLQDVAFNGDTGTAAPGFIARTFAGAAATLALTTETWSTATHAQIVVDITEMLNQMSVATGTNWGPLSGKGNLRLLISHIHYGTLLVKYDAGGSGEHAIATLERTFKTQGLQIIPLPQLNNAAANGTDERAITYHFDPEVVSIPVQEYSEMAPVLHDFEWTVATWARTPGVVAVRPLAVVMADVPE